MPITAWHFMLSRPEARRRRFLACILTMLAPCAMIASVEVSWAQGARISAPSISMPSRMPSPAPPRISSPTIAPPSSLPRQVTPSAPSVRSGLAISPKSGPPNPPRTLSTSGTGAQDTVITGNVNRGLDPSRRPVTGSYARTEAGDVLSQPSGNRGGNGAGKQAAPSARSADAAGNKSSSSQAGSESPFETGGLATPSGSSDGSDRRRRRR